MLIDSMIQWWLRFYSKAYLILQIRTYTLHGLTKNISWIWKLQILWRLRRPFNCELNTIRTLPLKSPYKTNGNERQTTKKEIIYLFLLLIPFWFDWCIKLKETIWVVEKPHQNLKSMLNTSSFVESLFWKKLLYWKKYQSIVWWMKNPSHSCRVCAYGCFFFLVCKKEIYFQLIRLGML